MPEPNDLAVIVSTYTIASTIMIQCPCCHGSGMQPVPFVLNAASCVKCGGTGWIERCPNPTA